MCPTFNIFHFKTDKLICTKNIMKQLNTFFFFFQNMFSIFYFPLNFYVYPDWLFTTFYCNSCTLFVCLCSVYICITHRIWLHLYVLKLNPTMSFMSFKIKKYIKIKQTKCFLKQKYKKYITYNCLDVDFHVHPIKASSRQDISADHQNNDDS